jgi:hypothetical protein
VYFTTDGTTSIDNALKTAEILWANQSRWKRELDTLVTNRLLPLKNDTWLEEGESPLTEDEFLSRMILESISVYNDGRFEFWHNDGDLFWGHAIQVRGNTRDGLTGADICG